MQFISRVTNPCCTHKSGEAPCVQQVRWVSHLHKANSGLLDWIIWISTTWTTEGAFHQSYTCDLPTSQSCLRLARTFFCAGDCNCGRHPAALPLCQWTFSHGTCSVRDKQAGGPGTFCQRNAWRKDHFRLTHLCVCDRVYLNLCMHTCVCVFDLTEWITLPVTL